MLARILTAFYTPPAPARRLHATSAVGELQPREHLTLTSTQLTPNQRENGLHEFDGRRPNYQRRELARPHPR